MRKPCLTALCPKYAEVGKSRCAECHRAFERDRKKAGMTGRRGTTAAWSKARLEALARGHWACARCGVHIATLKAKGLHMHVHHLDNDPTNHKQENLKPLCPACHKLTH